MYMFINYDDETQLKKKYKRKILHLYKIDWNYVIKCNYLYEFLFDYLIICFLLFHFNLLKYFESCLIIFVK